VASEAHAHFLIPKCDASASYRSILSDPRARAEKRRAHSHSRVGDNNAEVVVGSPFRSRARSMSVPLLRSIEGSRISSSS